MIELLERRARLREKSYYAVAEPVALVGPGQSETLYLCGGVSSWIDSVPPSRGARSNHFNNKSSCGVHPTKSGQDCSP